MLMCVITPCPPSPTACQESGLNLLWSLALHYNHKEALAPLLPLAIAAMNRHPKRGSVQQAALGFVLNILFATSNLVALKTGALTPFTLQATADGVPRPPSPGSPSGVERRSGGAGDSDDGVAVGGGGGSSGVDDPSGGLIVGSGGNLNRSGSGSSGGSGSAGGGADRAAVVVGESALERQLRDVAQRAMVRHKGHGRVKELAGKLLGKLDGPATPFVSRYDANNDPWPMQADYF